MEPTPQSPPSAPQRPGKADYDDLSALPPEERAELFRGEIIRKAPPSFDHSDAQGSLIIVLGLYFGKSAGGRNPGGWYILPETDIRLDADTVFRPDISGWRRERIATRPKATPVEIRPDWVCEVLSPSNRSFDLKEKLSVYHEAEVPHYWVVDPESKLLSVYRWSAPGYIVVLNATPPDRVRAEPFEAIEWNVGTLFGEDIDATLAPQPPTSETTK